MYWKLISGQLTTNLPADQGKYRWHFVVLGNCLRLVRPMLDMVQSIWSIYLYVNQHGPMWWAHRYDIVALPQKRYPGKFVNVLQLYALVYNGRLSHKYFALNSWAIPNYCHPNGMSIRAQWNCHNHQMSSSPMTTSILGISLDSFLSLDSYITNNSNAALVCFFAVFA